MSAPRTRDASPAVGSITQTAEDTVPLRTRIVGTLRLRGQPEDNGRRIRWAEDVVDNEGMGKKSSKVCCIYHRARDVGESSDESSSDSSSSDSDSDDGGVDNGEARMVGTGRRTGRGRRHHDHDHDHDPHDSAEDRKENGNPHGPGEDPRNGDGNDEQHGAGGRRNAAVRGHRKGSPNAYERVPKSR